MTTETQIIFRPMTGQDFDEVRYLANQVHGDNYLTEESVRDFYQRSITAQGRCLSWLAENNGKLVGIRLTFAPGKWDTESYCTPSKWPYPAEQMCYFKCAAIDQDCQGGGLGKSLLLHSIIEATTAGCKAGLAHIWRQSPNNSAMAYFSKCGGELIQNHADRWLQASVEDGYYCPVCDGECHCTAAEMVLPFANVELVKDKPA